MENVIPTKEVKALQAATTNQVSEIEAKSIRSLADLDEATGILKRVKALQKEATDRKEAITKPMNEALKSVRALFAPIEDALKNAETRLKSKMLTFQQAEARKAAEKAAEVEQKVASGEMTMEKAGQKVAVAEARAAAVPTMTVKKLQITDTNVAIDPVAATYSRKEGTVIPNEYWVLDTVKLRKDLLAGKPVPGASIVEEKTIRV